ncbi:MAG TPA: sigma-70 family RNA polymerase sigma factor [Terrimesophilobacter sp.]|nr:sigma-70 family RNA polymerase sigma factor [Terrimesophilobacter sp.]
MSSATLDAPVRLARQGATAPATIVVNAERTRVHSDDTTNAPRRWEDVVTVLVEQRGEALTRYAYFISGSADDAADLVQDALVKTFSRVRNGFTVASAEAYVRRAILNTHLDSRRRKQRWRRIAHLTAVPETTEPTDATDESLDLQHHLARLSPRERACVVLRYYEDLKVDDIAEQLEISAGTVKRYLSDALAKLGDVLGEQGGTHGR